MNSKKRNYKRNYQPFLKQNISFAYQLFSDAATMLNIFPSVLVFAILFFHNLPICASVLSSHAHFPHRRQRNTEKITQAMEIDIDLLRNEHITLCRWMDDWFNTANATDQASTTASLRQRIQAYDSWVKTWLDSRTAVEVSQSPLVSSILAAKSYSNPMLFTTRKNVTTTTIAVTITSTIQTGPVASDVSTSERLSLNAGPQPSQSPSGSMKIAVYYGQQNTDNTTLGQICRNPNVDIVVLAFLTHFVGPGGFPTVNFGAACGG